jgi:hypothetical protein
MKVAELATTVRDAITVSRVLAKPYESGSPTGLSYRAVCRSSS